MFDRSKKLITYLLLSLLLFVPSVQESFSQQLWKENSELAKQILVSPFIQGLKTGTLPKYKFDYYIQQDIIYIDTYARCFNILGAKSSNNKVIVYL